ncbi:MAG: hypothetical protein HY646_03060 [Acidobacteria bacterium]|nr:hypothetical protein [Acidobacteriota bacterium]
MERGASLIVAMVILAFLSIVGGALFMTAMIEVRIGDNYRTNTQLLYLAEAGIENARELLRTSTDTPSQLLARAAGADSSLSTSTDPSTLLAGDDVPLCDAEPLNDATGRVIGTYHVYLRNDVADDVTSVVDSNRMLTLLSFATIGKDRKVIETVVTKAMFPKLPAALTLNGSVDIFDALNSNLYEMPVGVIDAPDIDQIAGAFPDVRNIEGELDSRLKSASGLEELVKRMRHSATVLNPSVGQAADINDFGSISDYRAAVVDGDANLGPGTGFGILLVRGNLNVTGNFVWNGLILTIGQGVLHWNSGWYGTVNGGMLIARTRANDRSESNLLGTVLASRGAITLDLNGAAGTGFHYDASVIEAANRVFPYKPVSIREY